MSNARELAELGGSYGSGGFVGMKNRIINGAMVIDQRNAGASISISGSNSAYSIDRWNGFQSTDGAFTLQQVSDAPAGFINSLKFTTTTADSSLGATQWAAIRQNIEGLNTFDFSFGTASATSVTVSFWVKSSLTGTFGGAILNSAENRSYPFTYAISSANTWEQKSVTITGDTSGTWLTTNGVGMRLVFGLGVGSTYSGTANAWTGSSYIYSATGATSVIGTLNATWQITGVQLEKGSTATSFDYRPYGTELALCQRYCLVDSNYSVNFVHYGTGGASSTTACAFDRQFPVQMRVAPSITPSTQTGFLVDGAGVSPVTTAVTDQSVATPLWGRFGATVASGLTVGSYYGLAASGSGTLKTITYSAEL